LEEFQNRGMFKEKTSKKRQVLNNTHKKDASTLDEKHKHMIHVIQENMSHKEHLNNIYYQCHQELQQWKDKIQELYQEQKQDSLEYSLAWDSNLFYSDKLRNIKKEIVSLQDEQKEIEYYENTGTILFNYYELIDQQDQVQMSSIDINNQPPAKGRRKNLPITQRNILDAFQITPVNAISEEEAEALAAIVVPRDKMSLVNDYMLAVDSNHMKHMNDHHTNQCQTCDIALICLAQEGMMVCPTCGYQELLLVEQNRPIYRQSNKEASHCTYKRINHFNEWISQIQGKESTDIPEEIFEKIVQEIKKEKIKDLSKLSYNKMREILKKLHSNKYYEHSYYIIYRLNGIPAPNFPPELEEKMRNMFKEIQAPFLKYCPSNRKNFLSYSYVLYKFCQLLEKDEYLKYFTLLKSREKLHVQDQIWRRICEEVNWEFIQSI